MKTPLLISFLTLFIHLQTSAKILQDMLPFGSKEKIVKVRELPNTKAFQIKDGTYYDIGSLYTQKHFLWLGFSFGEPTYVGYIDSQQKYVPLENEEWNKIVEHAKIKLPENAEISFFDKFISRPLLFILLLLSGFYGKRYYHKRK